MGVKEREDKEDLRWMGTGDNKEWTVHFHYQNFQNTSKDLRLMGAESEMRVKEKFYQGREG